MDQGLAIEVPFCVVTALGEQSVVVHGKVHKDEVRCFSAEDAAGRPIRIPHPQVPSAIDALLREAARKAAS